MLLTKVTLLVASLLATANSQPIDQSLDHVELEARDVLSEPKITVVDNSVHIEIPNDGAPHKYVRVFQSQRTQSFFWKEGGSKFYQCNEADKDCTQITQGVTNDMDNLNQAAAMITSSTDPGKSLVFRTPELDYPNYGVFPMSFYVIIINSDGKFITRPLDTVIYKVDPASSQYYTSVPTTICHYGNCETTSIPYLKAKATTAVNGTPTTIDTYKTISYEPVTVQSYLTTKTIVTNGHTTSVVTYCPLTEA